MNVIAQSFFGNKITVMYRLKHTPESENKTIVDLFSFLSEKLSDYKGLGFIVAEEFSGGRHLTGLITAPKITADIVRELLKEFSPTAKGNKCLYSKVVDDLKQSIKYSVKEGNYVMYGYPDSFIERMKKCSNKKENINQKVSHNEEQFLNDDIPIEEFISNYIQIKVDHCQNIYHNHLRAYFLRIKLKKSKRFMRHYVEEYFSDIIEK